MLKSSGILEQENLLFAVFNDGQLVGILNFLEDPVKRGFRGQALLIDNHVFELEGGELLMLFQILKDEVFKVVFAVAGEGLDNLFFKGGFLGRFEGLYFLEFLVKGVNFLRVKADVLMERIQLLGMGAKLLRMELMGGVKGLKMLGMLLAGGEQMVYFLIKLFNSLLEVREQPRIFFLALELVEVKVELLKVGF